MKPLRGAVERLLRGLGLAEGVARSGAVDAWGHAATAVLGADAGATRALDVDGRTLVVAVPDPAWAAEIRLRERDLVTSILEHAPECGITSIRSIPARSVGERTSGA